MTEGARGVVGERERRNARPVEDFDARRHLGAAHPTGQHRLAGDVRVFGEALGDERGVGHVLRRENHQQAVAGSIFGRQLQRLGVARGIGITQDVDGIPSTPGGGKLGVEARQRLAIQAAPARPPRR